jgi:S-adenosylmethionine:tRNA ribosyltransferase-isomerase
MVIDRDDGQVKEHAVFRELGKFLIPGDLLVINQTRVIPARLFGWKIPGGGRIELLLLRRISSDSWECLVGGKGLVVGKQLQVDSGPLAWIAEDLGGARRMVRFDRPLEPILDSIGHVPLPPYIHEKLRDPERYQTVFAKEPGSSAAPTAGLHFTPGLIQKLEHQGIKTTTITLHVGLDTFAPVNEDDPSQHVIHTEWCHVEPETVQIIKKTRSINKRIIAVGTTSVRALETLGPKLFSTHGTLFGYTGPTDLFILPGYEFQVVDAMITNFHLPRSTLIMLVSAFVSREEILAAYEIAKQKRYRFYSFGDAMLII